MATELPFTLGDYFDVVRRRWIYPATIMPAVVLGALYLAYSLPSMYRSSGTILLEPSSIPEDMIRTTVTTYANQHIELVQSNVMATENLVTLVDELDPYPNRSDLSRNDKARLVAANTSIQRVDPVTLEPLPESTAFSMHYENPDPNMAVAVAERLVEMFLAYNRETRTRRASENYNFLLTQSDEVSATIADLERQLAIFKGQYGEALPEAQDRNLQALDRTQRDLDTLEREIRVAREQKGLLEIRLNQINPYLFDSAGDWRTELAKLNADLAEARQKYSEDHPTIRRLTRSIDAMSARVGATASTAPVARPDNPEYIQTANQLQTVDRELSALQASAARAREQVELYENRSAMAPEVEREYRQLDRDYEVAQERFRQIETNLSEAAAARTLESEQRGERFTLIGAPYRPTSPSSPNRLGLLLLGVVLGGALGVGLAAIMESSDPSIRSARDLYEITDIKPLAAVPSMLNDADKRKRFVTWLAASVVAAIAVTFVGLTVAQAS